MRHRFSPLRTTLLGTSLFALLGAPALAQMPDAERVEDDGFVVEDEVVTIGTRRVARSAADTPAPVDVISAVELRSTASTDVQTLLRTAVPSFNVATQPISDTATIIRPANLRGLSPDQTLVLVNGKRRHRSAIITSFGGGISDGAQPVDISSIPSIALKQVEVLRDGASSQYGSDAIAGVINFNLQDAAQGGMFEAQFGSTYDGDGDEWRLSGNIGLPLGTQGFVNLSAEYGEADPTDRSAVPDDVQAQIDAGNAAVADFGTITGGFSDDGPFIWGRSGVEDDLKLFVNSGLDLSPTTSLYAHGGYASRTVSNSFFYRGLNPFGAIGGFGPNGPAARVGDLDGVGTGSACPADIPFSGPAGLPDAAVASQVAADPNCFSLLEVFPGGFTPRFSGETRDFGLTLGIEGIWDLGGGISYDLSLTHGTNEVDLFLANSFNPSLGPASPTDFFIGGQQQSETVLNADFAYLVDLGLASELSVAFGGEYRDETFSIGQGDAASFAAGPLATQGFGTGSNGFPGFSDDLSASQDSIAAYVDLEADLTGALTLQGALRYEDYSAFGDTIDYKIAGLYRLTPAFTVRATHSTGFHAPTAGQANLQRVNVEVVDNQLVDVASLPINSGAGQLVADFIASTNGGVRPELGPEEANIFTVGAAFDLGPTTWTIDAYQIDVDDRISEAQGIDFGAVVDFAAADAGVTLGAGQTVGQDIAQLSAAGVLSASDFVGFENLAQVSLFANSFDTRTRGVDVVARWPFAFLNGASALTVAANYNEIEVTDRGTVNPIDDFRVAQLEDLLPNIKGFASWTHQQGRWSGLVRANYFGEWRDAVFFGDGAAVEGDEIIVDAELTYEAMDGVELIVGAANIFDNFPDRRGSNANGDFPLAAFGQVYPDFSPSGFVGGQWYTRLRVTF
ncbi:MAG: TonB-dependent receptor [Litorimonas sp.]